MTTLIEENLHQLEVSRHLGLVGTLASYTTASNDYATVKDLQTVVFTTKILTFRAKDNNLKVTILGDSYGDKSFATTVEEEFTVTKEAPALVKSISDSYAGLRIMVKPAVAGQNGILQTCVTFTDVPPDV